MIIKRIHSLYLKNVVLKLTECDCYLHDYEFMNVSEEELVKHLEGSMVLVYTADFTATIRYSKCPWCERKNVDKDHIFDVHRKTQDSLKVLRFQQALYKEKLALLRAGKIDHTYIVYTNWLCQYCDDKRARGRGICSIPESARNKVRSLNVLGLEASNFPATFRDKKNIGYLIGYRI